MTVPAILDFDRGKADTQEKVVKAIHVVELNMDCKHLYDYHEVQIQTLDSFVFLLLIS